MDEQTVDTSMLPVFGVTLMHEVRPTGEELGMTPKTNSGGTNGECF